MFSPKRLIFIGVILLILGVVLPFLMVLHIVETSFTLSFLSYAASVAGLFLGIIGIATLGPGGRRR